MHVSEKAILLFALCVCQGVFAAYIKSGVSDWTVAGNYWENAVPGAGVQVNIGGNNRNEITSGTPSWDIFQRFSSVQFDGANSELTITVPEGCCATNKVPLFGSGGNNAPVYDSGVIVKRGGGTLVLQCTDAWLIHNEVSCAYLTKEFKVEEGEVVFLEDDRKLRIGNVNVAAGAALHLPRRTGGAEKETELAACYLSGLSGAGVVTNASPVGVPLVLDRPFTNSFNGAIGGIQFQIANEGVSLTLGNENNSFNVENGIGTITLVRETEGSLGIGADSSFTGDLTVLKGDIAAASNMSYFKWVCMQCYGAEGVESGLSHYGIYLEEFGLFDKDGNRVNLGLVQAPSADSVAPGQAAFVDAGHVQGYDFTLGGQNFTGKIFNGEDDTETWMVMPRYSISLSAEDSSVTLLMRLTAGAAAVDSYDFASGAPNYHSRGYHPTRWKMLGSFDGVNWTEIDNRYGEMQSLPADSKNGYYVNCWNLPDENSAFVSCTAVPHKGYRLKSWTSLANIRKLRVAKNARLVASGENTVEHFIIDADDAGSLEGVKLADSGTLEIVNLDFKGGFPVTVPGNCGIDGDEFKKLLGWNVTVNGKIFDAKYLRFENGQITLVPRGFRMLLH